MKIAILGMGGVGATVAGALKQQEKDLIFLVRGETKSAILAHGLSLASEAMGDMVITPSLVSDDPKEVGIVDVLFLTCKSYGLAAACESYRDIVGQNTLVIPLQNGVTAPEAVAEYLQGRGKIAHGYIYCLSNIVTPGQIKNIGNLLRMGIGFPKGTDQDPRVEQLAHMLTGGGLPTTHGADIEKAIWEKYAMMCGNSCAFLYYDTAAGEIQSVSERMDFLEGVYEDILHLAYKAGVGVSTDMPQKYREEFMSLPPETTSSLYRDVRDGKKQTEFEFLVGNACRMAEDFHMQVPFLEKVYDKMSEK